MCTCPPLADLASTHPACPPLVPQDIADQLQGGDMQVDYDQILAKRPHTTDSIFAWHQVCVGVLRLRMARGGGAGEGSVYLPVESDGAAHPASQARGARALFPSS